MSASPFDVVRGGSSVVLVAFPPPWAGFEMDETDNDLTTAERPETGRQVLARLPRVVAIMDGAMFELPGGGTNYANATKARLLYRYLDRRRGIDRPSRYPERGATISVAPDGTAHVQSGALEVQGATFAAQGYPELIRRGAVVIGTRDADVTGRAAFCLLHDGRVAFAVGRASMIGFARALLALPIGVTDAVYTDGGGSTTLGLRGEGGALVVGQGLDARRLPVYLIAEAPTMGPGMVSDPAAGASTLGRFAGPAVKVLGAAAGAAGLVAVVRSWWRGRAAE